MPFKTPEGDPKEIFITDYELIDRFVGNRLWAWGNGSYGFIGDLNTLSRSSPVQTVSTVTTWKEVVAGRRHAVALKTDGTLWSWGGNNEGQLGDNTTTPRSSPVQTIAGGTTWKIISSCRYHTAGIKTDGTLWMWGRNNLGQLGDNTTTSRSSPVQTIAGGTTWKTVSCGLGHTTAIKTDGTLWTWGYNVIGQLGDNTTTPRSSPVQTVAGGTMWRSVSAGGYNTAAIKIDGTLWVWGDNIYGQLGDNSITPRSSPVQTVTGGTLWKAVSCGRNHTTAIKVDGTLWVWGDNTVGQLGDNSTTSRSSPVQTIAGGVNWKTMSCYNHTAAIKIDGTLWLWGRNADGQLGDNSTTFKSSPVQTIALGTTWKGVATGYANTAAVTFGDS